MMMDVFIRGLGAIRRVNGSQPVEWRASTTERYRSMLLEESVTVSLGSFHALLQWNFDGEAGFSAEMFVSQRTWMNLRWDMCCEVGRGKSDSRTYNLSLTSCVFFDRVSSVHFVFVRMFRLYRRM